MDSTKPRSSQSRHRSEAIRELAAILIGMVVAAGVLGHVSEDPETRFEDLALGATSTSYFARDGDHPIHCETLEDAQTCLDGFRARGSERATLWLGNSQLHSVNEMKRGEETAAAVLSRRLRRAGLDLLTFSQPNANLQEHLVLFVHLMGALPVDLLVLPVVFDDLRETGIRSRLMPALRDTQTVEALSASEVGRRIVEQAASSPTDDFAALDETVQDSVETGLNDWLGSRVQLWASRPQMRGQLFTSLYKIRNTVLGITAQSTRRLIPSRYDLNMASLDAMLDTAARSGVEALVYIVPIRDDVEIPYDRDEYAAFKRDVELTARRHHAMFANLESIVPGRFWGRTYATNTGAELDLDFMHFQAAGHTLLAEALSGLLEFEVGGNRR